ncbi:WAS protein family 1 [Rhynchospora pubera]|uniref:WAS protein family 1 n=1 Tax=Rhynchospora pubera TaxID=906938 RepID=A0AAV8CIL8_9POAL|nr:WAS protein family 1 [Rhynchospora pubera]
MFRVSETEGRATRREGHVARYRQMGHTLLELQRAADQVFDAVSLKIAEERDKLSHISNRIKVAKAKISEISNSESEVKIVSPAQHPVANTAINDFKPLFQDKDEGEKLGFPVASLSVNGGLNREFGTDGTLELFQFFSEENCAYQLKGTDMKDKRSLSQIKDDTSLEKHFEKSSFLATSNFSLGSTSDIKGDQLPPPPPSLSPSNLKSHRSAD